MASAGERKRAGLPATRISPSAWSAPASASSDTGVGITLSGKSFSAGSSWATVAMAPTGVADEYSGGIPGQPQGTRIRLYVSAADNASNAATDPATPYGTALPWLISHGLTKLSTVLTITAHLPRRYVGGVTGFAK